MENNEYSMSLEMKLEEDYQLLKKNCKSEEEKLEHLETELAKLMKIREQCESENKIALRVR